MEVSYQSFLRTSKKTLQQHKEEEMPFKTRQCSGKGQIEWKLNKNRQADI